MHAAMNPLRTVHASAAATWQVPPPAGPDQVALSPEVLRRALGSCATGVTVITTVDDQGRPIGLTANSFTSVSLDPALVLWCLSGRSVNLEVFRSASAYAINILDSTQTALCQRFSDRNVVDRFAGVNYHQGQLGAPVLDGCVASLECEHWEIHPAGDHVLFVGRVRTLSQRDGTPLVFSNGKLGNFFVPPALV